jgi:hypothetical protein
MAKDILQYNAETLPSGSAGGQFQPYRDAPPMLSPNAGDVVTAAQMRLGKSVENAAEDWARLQAREQEHSDQVKANYLLNEFSKDQILKQATWNEGVRGIQAWDEDLIKSRRQELETEKKELLAGAGLKSEKVKYAFGVALNGHEENILSRMGNHIEAVRHEVEAGNIRADYEERKLNVSLGADPEVEAKRHNAIVDINQPWNEAVKKEHLEELRGLFVRVQAANKAAKEDVKLTGIYSQIMVDAENDPDKALKILADPKSIEKYGMTTKERDNIMGSVAHNAKVKDDAYKVFSENAVGKAKLKIYNGVPLSSMDIFGLEPKDVALIEQIKDYQIRQDRAEIKFNESEKRAISTEKRAARYEARLFAEEKSKGIEGGITARILRGEPVDIKDDIYAQIPKGLDIHAPERLISMMSRIQKDPKYKPGLDVIDGTFAKGDPQHGIAVIDFQKAVDAEEATGKRVIEIAQEIVKPKKENKVMEMINNIFGNVGNTLNQQGKTSVNIPTQADLEYTAKKHGITVAEVKKRMGLK